MRVMAWESSRTYLIVGASGSGKTSACLALCNQYNFPVTLFNASLRDYSLLKPVARLGTWGEKLDVKKHTLVVEDIQSLKPAQKEFLSHLLNVVSRHQNCVIILIAHSLHGNGLFALINFFTNIVVTAGTINLRNLRELLRHFMYEESEAVENVFLSMNARDYLMLKPHERVFSVLSTSMSTTSEDAPAEMASKDIKREKVLSYFAHLPNKQMYNNLFDFLMANIPNNVIRPSDVTILVLTKNGKKCSVSLLDYMYFLLEKNQGYVPSDVLLLHRHFKKMFRVPDMFVKNKLFIEENKRSHNYFFHVWAKFAPMTRT